MAEEPIPAALEEARQLARDRRWRDLATLACGVSEDVVESYPELAYLLADSLRRVGDLETSVPLAKRAALGAARRNDTRLRLRSGNLLGMLEFAAGQIGESKDSFEGLLHFAMAARDDEFAARASNNLGIIASIHGERELALTSYQRALAAYQRLGYARGLAQTHYNVAIVYRDLGFPEETEGNLALALRYAEKGPDEDVMGLIDTERALLLAAAGDGALAEKIGERGLELMRRIGNPLGEANAERALAAAAIAQNRPASALHRLDHALATVELHPDLLLRAEIQRDRGALLLEAGDLQNARSALRDSLQSFEAIGARLEAEATSRLLSRLPEE